MTHLSGGAVSGIVFGTMLFVFVSASLMLWWRRVHRDLYSKDPNVWGGSWGVKAQRETQARIWKQREEAWALAEAERSAAAAEEANRAETWNDVEMHVHSKAGENDSMTAAGARVEEEVKSLATEVGDVKTTSTSRVDPEETTVEVLQK